MRRQLQAADVAGELGALQGSFEVEDLGCRIVAFAASAGRIDRDQILLAGDRRQPDLQLAVEAEQGGRRRRQQPRLDGGQLED